MEDRDPFDAPLPDAPHWSLWFVYLAFRPKLFFETYVLTSVPVLTALTAWLYGIVSVMDRVGVRTLTSQQRNGSYEFMLDDWRVYWAAAAVMGALTGLVYFGIGGWWYRVRLEWCGASEPDATLARRVYLYASQAYVLPFLVYTGWETLAYASPRAAARGEDAGAFVIIVVLFWSVYVSYRGVRTAFDVRRWAARVWFGILPAAIYGVGLAGLMVGLFTGAFVHEPDLKRTLRVDRAGFALEYPGNWFIDTTDEEYDADRYFTIEPDLADAAIHFWFYAEPMESGPCVEQTVENLSGAYEIGKTKSLERWGEFAGAGYHGRVTISGASFEFVAFCSTDRSIPFEILQLAHEDAADKLRPGFDLVRDSLELHE